MRSARRVRELRLERSKSSARDVLGCQFGRGARATTHLVPPIDECEPQLESREERLSADPFTNPVDGSSLP
jgi:hypothetical protein